MAKSEVLSSTSSIVVKNPKSQIQAEAYLNGTSQELTSEDAWPPGSESLQLGEKDDHIRGRN